MLFTSYEFLCIFLPSSFLAYFFLARFRYVRLAKLSLVISSLIFYSYWDIKYLPLLLGSILFNFIIGSFIVKSSHKKKLLLMGIIVNLCLLGYYKYTGFFIQTINEFSNFYFFVPQILLPLGISFFTFTQTAFLVDTYRGEISKYDLLTYSLFVTFFPHLIAGPILYHKNIIPQFSRLRNFIISYKNISKGLALFSVGLFKKLVLADTLASWANNGFDHLDTLNFLQAWATSFAYTFQLYFDFSGYTDMAIGLGYLFNIVLPFNFNSPYCALNIQDFWRRWHVTLGDFLKNYVYVPLGGNRRGQIRTYYNLILTFVLGGLWHGAGWTFIFWGFMHGIGLALHRLYMSYPIVQTPRWFRWLITFNFVNIAWIFFRAQTLDDAMKILQGMVKLKTLNWSSLHSLNLLNADRNSSVETLIVGLILIVSFFITTRRTNSNILVDKFKPNWRYLLILSAMVAISIFHMHRISDFLYFNF